MKASDYLWRMTHKFYDPFWGETTYNFKSWGNYRERGKLTRVMKIMKLPF